MTHLVHAGDVQRPLVRRFPRLAERPFWPLADVPTPVTRLDVLATELGRDDVWMKRDDVSCRVFGGNKVRRYEWLFADAHNSGFKRVVTVGGTGSSQVTATAILGKYSGFEVSAALFDQPFTPSVQRALACDVDAHARLLYRGGYLRTALAYLGEKRRGAYAIPPGASTPMANIGYVDAVLELAEQVERGELPKPDLIVLPVGTGGTMAGICVGLGIVGWNTHVMPVRITSFLVCNGWLMGGIVRDTHRYLERAAGEPIPAPAPFTMLHGYVGQGYGYPTQASYEGERMLSKVTNSPGETTYTGKAMAALRDLAKAHPTKNILYWNTLSSYWPELPATPAEAKTPRALLHSLGARLG